MQKAKHENSKVLNRQLAEWAGIHNLPAMTKHARQGLINIIEHQANRLAMQKISFNQEIIGGQCFREEFRSK